MKIENEEHTMTVYDLIDQLVGSYVVIQLSGTHTVQGLLREFNGIILHVVSTINEEMAGEPAGWNTYIPMISVVSISSQT